MDKIAVVGHAFPAIERFSASHYNTVLAQAILKSSAGYELLALAVLIDGYGTNVLLTNIDHVKIFWLDLN
jgi:hypothetical protein